MSPEAQRIAIAKACGWMEGNHRAYQNYYIHQKVHYVGDPTQDLNAMHEAEKVLDSLQKDDYSDFIKSLAGEGFYPIHATAAQRAKAFLRTIGKWEDGK